jgi:hypothetical protein
VLELRFPAVHRIWTLAWFRDPETEVERVQAAWLRATEHEHAQGREQAQPRGEAAGGRRPDVDDEMRALAHADHRACWNLVYGAWLSGGKRFALYYMEAMSGHQSQGFVPTDRVDIGAVRMPLCTVWCSVPSKPALKGRIRRSTPRLRQLLMSVPLIWV